MSRTTLKEALEGRSISTGGTPVNKGGSTWSPVLRLAEGGMPRPVDLVRTLIRNGLTLRKAHGVLARVADGVAVPVELPAVLDEKALAAQLRDLGVLAAPRREPPMTDVAALRQRLGLTQAEFAAAYGFELDSVRNWEQGRSVPERATRILLAVVARHPDLVAGVLDEMWAPAA